MIDEKYIELLRYIQNVDAEMLALKSVLEESFAAPEKGEAFLSRVLIEKERIYQGLLELGEKGSPEIAARVLGEYLPESPPEPT